MAATADQMAALGQDAQFISRLRSILLQQAEVVYGEDPATPNHVQRLAYAKSVFVNANGFAVGAAQFLATRTNLSASNITYNFSSRFVVTDATDAAILAQIASDWNMLAGV